MRQFYRVHAYSEVEESNPVFFHDRENAVAYFLELAKQAEVLAWQILENEHGNMVAFGWGRTIILEPMNFED